MSTGPNSEVPYLITAMAGALARAVLLRADLSHRTPTGAGKLGVSTRTESRFLLWRTGLDVLYALIRIREYMRLAQYIDTLNVLGDENRIRLCVLLRERELCVTDLVRATDIAQSRVSTHLARLRDSGFVRIRKHGAQTFY